jgi:poly(A) polymerase
VPHTFTPTFSRELLDPDALDIARRLIAEGHVTYLVGGCVRDLLLGRAPKDFDLATTARPEELKQIFGRRCRIIGRRFRLAHVYTGGATFYEVATFRGLPDDQETAGDASGFVVRANTFGTPEQDARSRDFTVNGLFYDPARHLVIDHVNGTADVERRLLRAIGPADQRLREDPVRLLRAVKFVARLGLTLDPELEASAPMAAPLIATCPVARVSEELLRLAESGYTVDVLGLFERLGALPHLAPELDAWLARHPERRETVETWLRQLDRLQRIHGTLPREATFALLLWPFIWADLMARPDARDLVWGRYALGHARSVALRLAVPVRLRQTLAGMFDVLKRLHYFPHKRPSPQHLRHFGVPLALTVLRTRFLLGDTSVVQAYDTWASAAAAVGLCAAPFEPREGDSDGPSEPRQRDGKPSARPSETPKASERREPRQRKPVKAEAGARDAGAAAPSGQAELAGGGEAAASGDPQKRKRRRRRKGAGPANAPVPA